MQLAYSPITQKMAAHYVFRQLDLADALQV